MFISKKELEEIRAEIKSLKQAVNALKTINKKQAEAIKKLEESSQKKYIHEIFEGKDEKETASIMDEWLNGAKEDKVNEEK